jgi:hypothetical protein
MQVIRWKAVSLNIPPKPVRHRDLAQGYHDDNASATPIGTTLQAS